jgi:hypothetical protein
MSEQLSLNDSDHIALFLSLAGSFLRAVFSAQKNPVRPAEH